MKILIIGSGAREHAIISCIKRSNPETTIYAISGNAGIGELAHNIKIAQDNHKEIIKFCLSEKIDFVIVGPEAPLVNGIVDDLINAEIKVFGPNREAAMLEASKSFTKRVCDEYNIPTAKYGYFENLDESIQFLSSFQDQKIVVKADGLAAGKGVIIAENIEEAINALREIFSGKFGEAGSSVVIEEFLDGDEVSFFAICDGDHAKFLGTAEDHKRAYDQDMGPNTGGMGTFSPSHYENPQFISHIMKDFIDPTLKAMKDKGFPFVGILFAGLIITKDGAKLLEYNTRFGDPETESILPRLESNLLSLMKSAVNGSISKEEVVFSHKKAITVIYAGKDYPEKSSKDSLIDISKISLDNDSYLFHAGTKIENQHLLSNGGRVLAICSLADSLEDSRSKAYQIISDIYWPDGYYRKDIGIKKPRFL